MICAGTFTLAIFFSAAVAFKEPDCNLKEEVWCESLANAMTCGAYTYCLSSVWPKGIREDIPCHEGQRFVKQFQQTMMDRKFDASKWTHLGKLCGGLDAELEENCRAALKENRVETMRLMNSTVRPTTIAKILNLCVDQTVNKKETKICSDCRAFFGDIEHLVIGPEVEKNMRKKMDEFCHQLPDGLTKMCLNMTDDWIKHFFLFLNEELKFDRFCYVANFCSDKSARSYNKSSLFSKNSITDFTCKPCKDVMDQLRGVMDNPTFQNDAEVILETAVCTFLPKHMVETCRKQIRSYISFIFDFLDVEMDSEMMCEIFRLCSKPANGQRRDHGFFNIISSLIHTTSKETMPLFSFFSNQGPQKRSTECSMCEIFVKEIVKMISTPQAKEEIVYAFERLCQKLPQPWGDECKKFVEANGRDIIDSIISSLSPKELCATIGFCESLAGTHRRAARAAPIVTMHLAEEEADEGETRTPLKSKDSEWCSLCRHLATIAQRLFGGKELATALDIVENTICSVLPKGLAMQCSELFNKVIDAILAGASSVFDPELLCESVGVCESKKQLLHFTAKSAGEPQVKTQI